ncbi:transcriptional regulator, IclR family [Natronorubrum sediminis]|uniref:Transcriptional regulator, IclR family n=1 Tax=Natronorubrum sediminis TaxID=640943 RepID=A0A1H6G4B5_9EURY|nr:IclR family transcriptional regulator [Natronorubrum sediminis]SEH17442.1 transcriptional regulator, IclR family [Natronorubrum sediminis]
MPEDDGGQTAGTVQTSQTMFVIVEYIKEQDGATITEVANELGYAKSTVHRHLSTLTEMGYAVKEGNEFHVGLRFVDLGQHARTRRNGYELAREKVDQIAAATGERAQFIVEEHGEGVYLHRSFGEHAIRTDPGIGSRIPLHATAAGKAILANLEESRRFEIIEQTDFDSLTEHTITDTKSLFEELETIRERGYAFNRQENLNGLYAVGVAVKSPTEGVIGAFSVSGPIHRLKGERIQSELPDRLLGTANELELNITHS